MSSYVRRSAILYHFLQSLQYTFVPMFVSFYPFLDGKPHAYTNELAGETAVSLRS